MHTLRAVSQYAPVSSVAWASRVCPRVKVMITLVIACHLLWFSSSAMARELQLVRNEKALEQLVAEQLLTDIYQRAGLTLHVEPLPGARANAMMLSGDKDGEVARIKSYFDKNPTLLRVDPPYYFLTSTVFAKAGRGIAIKDAADLAKFRVGIVRGIAHAEAATADLSKVERVVNYEQLYRMLDADRIDLAIDTGINGRAILQTLGLSRLEPVGDIARLELYHGLNPSHKNLPAAIGNVIQKMKKSGELDKLVRKTEDAVLKSYVGQ
jgi:polar amino acid transport system substrate-binding protein